jgi:RNA polymerase sigma-70 factor (ECF subfamily)
MAFATVRTDGHIIMDGIVERCRVRDETAWRELYDGHFEFVRRVAFQLGTPSSELDDVVQDVFVIAFRRLEQFETGRFTTWLYRICANIVSARHRHRRVRRTLAAWLPWAVQPSSAEAPGRDLERTRTDQAVQRVLERMSPKKREVLVLFELEGLAARDIAERVGCAEATVFTRLHHARREFQQRARRLGLLDQGSRP